MRTHLALWQLPLRADHLEKSLEAAINAGCEVTVPIRPLDLLNDVTPKLWALQKQKAATLVARDGCC